MMNPGMVVPEKVPYNNEGTVKKLAEAQNAFTLALYKELASDKTGNLFFSPLSIMTAIAMVHAGAGGVTSQEIEKVLQLATNTSEIHLAFEEIMKDFKNLSEDYTLNNGNAAYVHKDMSLLEEFKSVLQNHFKSVIEAVDFNNPEPVRQQINTYIEEETAEKIKELIPPGILNSDTRMVLVNAVYFKGLWENPFDHKQTKVQPFWIDEATKVPVEMMNIKKKLKSGVIAELDARGLEMNYKGSRLSMIILLPNAKNGLAEMEKKLDNFNLMNISDTWSSNMDIQVSIPKFKLEETYGKLEENLGKMGMATLFDVTKCDLSGITGAKDLFVSNVVHKAYVEVNEEGSEAAAATAMIMMTRAIMRPNPPFLADHPFMFLIKDSRSGTVIFVGRFSHPQQKS